MLHRHIYLAHWQPWFCSLCRLFAPPPIYQFNHLNVYILVGGFSCRASPPRPPQTKIVYFCSLGDEAVSLFFHFSKDLFEQVVVVTNFASSAISSAKRKTAIRHAFLAWLLASRSPDIVATFETVSLTEKHPQQGHSAIVSSLLF